MSFSDLGLVLAILLAYCIVSGFAHDPANVLKFTVKNTTKITGVRESVYVIMNHVDCMNFKFNFLTILYIINLFLIAEEYKCPP